MLLARNNICIKFITITFESEIDGMIIFGMFDVLYNDMQIWFRFFFLNSTSCIVNEIMVIEKKINLLMFIINLCLTSKKQQRV